MKKKTRKPGQLDRQEMLDVMGNIQRVQEDKGVSRKEARRIVAKWHGISVWYATEIDRKYC